MERDLSLGEEDLSLRVSAVAVSSKARIWSDHA